MISARIPIWSPGTYRALDGSEVTRRHRPVLRRGQRVRRLWRLTRRRHLYVEWDAILFQAPTAGSQDAKIRAVFHPRPDLFRNTDESITVSTVDEHKTTRLQVGLCLAFVNIEFHK